MVLVGALGLATLAGGCRSLAVSGGPASSPTAAGPASGELPSIPECPFDRTATIRVQGGSGSVIPREGETITGFTDDYDPVKDEPIHGRISVTLSDGVVAAEGYTSERRNAPLETETSDGTVVLPNPYECRLRD